MLCIFDFLVWFVGILRFLIPLLKVDEIASCCPQRPNPLLDVIAGVLYRVVPSEPRADPA